MKLIGISSQKGGVGKTTLAMNLAIASAMSGKPTIVFDLDPQQSIKSLHRIRTGQGHSEQPMVVACSPQTLRDAMIAAQEDGYEVGFIDTPPNVHSDEAKMAAGADIVIVPTTPSIIDLVAVRASIEIAQMPDSTGRRPNGFAVINMATHYGDHVEKTRAAIENDFSFPVAPVTIGNRVGFKNAAELGLGILENEPNSKGAEEILELWSFVQKALKEARKPTTRKAVANG